MLRLDLKSENSSPADLGSIATGCTLVVGGDGRYFNIEALQVRKRFSAVALVFLH
jgi:hypothetical protein